MGEWTDSWQIAENGENIPLIFQILKKWNLPQYEKRWKIIANYKNSLQECEHFGKFWEIFAKYFFITTVNIIKEKHLFTVPVGLEIFFKNFPEFSGIFRLFKRVFMVYINFLALSTLLKALSFQEWENEGKMFRIFRGLSRVYSLS